MNDLLILAHDLGGVVNTQPDEYLGSPMYEVAEVHGPALFAALALGIWFLVARRRRDADGNRPRGLRWSDLADPTDRVASWMMALSAVGHAALVPGHLDSFYGALFLADAVVLGLGLRHRSQHGTWPRWLRPVLVASLLGYALSSASGESPDQVGLMMKLLELGALFLTARRRVPGHARRRAALATTGHLAVAVLVAGGAWIGAMSAGEGGHHFWQTPPPGVLIPPGVDREPTAAETAAAQDFLDAVRTSLVRYEDPAVAAADGFNVTRLQGNDFHADNEARKHDDHVMDPDHPETLVYGVDAAGRPVVLGAMFQMDGIGDSGPAIGGPLTVWHAHDHICASPIPPFLAGLAGPWGTCPLGSITLPITNEMFHVWTVPGAPEPFGDLSKQWRAEHLASLG